MRGLVAFLVVVLVGGCGHRLEPLARGFNLGYRC